MSSELQYLHRKLTHITKIRFMKEGEYIQESQEVSILFLSLEIFFVFSV